MMGSTFRRRPLRGSSALAILAAGVSAMLSGLALAEPAKLTIDRLFAAPDLSGATLRGARFSPDGKLVTYLQGKTEAKDRLDVWAYDTATKRSRLLVDSASLVADEGKLSPEEEARRERARRRRRRPRPVPPPPARAPPH